MSPPVVSVAGFTNVDRGLFRAVSNVTKELECCKKQVRLIGLRNSFKINLQISGDGTSSTRSISILHWNIHSHFCQRFFINGRSETRSNGDCMSFISKSANVRKEAPYLCPIETL